MKSRLILISALVLFGAAMSFMMYRADVKQHKRPKITIVKSVTPTPSPLPMPTEPVIVELPVALDQHGSDTINFSGGISGIWITIHRHKSYSGGEQGWEPSYTSLVSDYKPIVHLLPNKKWEIEFSQDKLAEGQP